MRFAKTSYVVAAAVVGMLAVGAQAADAPPNPKDLTMGKWQLNAAKSKFGCTEAPKVSIRNMFDAGFGMMVTEWTGTRADGKPFDTRYVWRYDGEKYPAGLGPNPANEKSESIAWKLVDAHHVTFIHYDQKDKVTQNLKRDVSADGNVMTQVTEYVGRNCSDVQVFERQ